MANQGKARSKTKAKEKARTAPTARPDGLNPKQLRFCAEFVIDSNGTQAAIRAGYSEKAAGQIASALLRKANVAAEIERLRSRVATKLEVTAERVLGELAKIAFADVRKVAAWDGGLVVLRQSEEIDDDTAAAIESVGRTDTGVKVTMHSKTRALELLGKHLGLYVDRVKLENPEEVARAIAAAQSAIDSSGAFPAPPAAEKAA